LSLKKQLQEAQAAMRALGESETFFRSVYENAPVGIFRAQPCGFILLANPAFLSILGARSLEELSGWSFCCERCVSGEVPRTCEHNLRSTETPEAFEAEWTRVDGEPLFVRIRARLLGGPEPGGRFIEGVVSDATAARRAQYRLTFLETALETMDLGFTITDSAHRILYANSSEASMHGMSVDELIGTDARELAPESLRHQMDWRAGLGRNVYRREGLNRKKDGRLFPVFLTSVPIVGKSGVPLGLITTCEDLTAAKQKDLQLQEALRDAVVGKLAAMVAHQVNTPLAAMKTRLELLREDVPEREEAQHAFGILMKQVDKVAQTVRALLGFVRQRSIAPREVLLQDVVASVAGLYETVFRSKGVSLRLSMPEEKLLLQASAADLQEVFLNLLENHREALGAGHHVDLSARRNGGVVEITVEDDGPGLGAEPEKVFEPFYTTKATGTGLGLPICRNICVACGGAITAENRPASEGGGARFRIVLPHRVPFPEKESAP
jgi:PAS domain S-box-containing protein